MFSKRIIIAIVIIIILIIAAIVFYRSDYLKRFLADTYEDTGSHGYESVRVRNAINELRGIGKKTGRDHFRLARLISNNLIDDEADGEMRKTLKQEAAKDYIEFIQNEEEPHRTQLDMAREFGHRYLNEDDQLRLALQQSVDNANNTINTKMRAGENKGTNRFRQLINRANDKQNVHDSAVVASSQKVAEKLKQSRDPAIRDDDLDAKIAEIAGGNARAKRAVDNIRTLNTTMTGYNGKGEYSILRDTVARIYDPRNDETRENMIGNLRMNLADCISENGELTCATGRVSRVLQSLTLNDYEQRDEDAIGGTLEDYKNEIFHECHKELQSEIENSAPEPLYALHNGKISYDDFYGKKENLELEQKFNDSMKVKFDNIISKYREKIPEHQVQSIRDSAYAALD